MFMAYNKRGRTQFLKNTIWLTCLKVIDELYFHKCFFVFPIDTVMQINYYYYYIALKFSCY